MNDFSKNVTRTIKVLTILFAILISGTLERVEAQAPYALPYTITKVAGGGTPLALTAPATGLCLSPSSTMLQYDNYGDGCQDLSPSVVLGFGVTPGSNVDIGIDTQGNIYFLDYKSGSYSLARRIDARSGAITVAAGTTISSKAVCSGTIDAYGDGCPATDGHANASGGYTYLAVQPRGLSVAKNGDLVLSSYSYSVVSKISALTGTMSHIAGFLSGSGKSASGVSGFGGNGGLATSAYLKSPRDAAFDSAGNIYIADSGNAEIRMVNATTGIISVIAGSPTAVAGSSGDQGPATAALLTTPEGVDVDAYGDIYIAAFGNASVRLIYEGGPAAAKLISATNPGVTPQIGYIYTVMGGGSATYGNGTYALATTVSGGNPRKLRLDPMGNIYVAENGYNVIDFIDAATGYMHVIAGTYGKTSGGTGCTPATGTADAYGNGCPATLATLYSNSTMSVAVDANENIYVTDSGDDQLRKVSTNRDFPATAVGSSLTQTLDIHFAPGDGPTASNPFTMTGNTDFVVGTPSCTTNADTTQDCLVSVTFKPTVAGHESAVLNVASNANGISAIGVEGTGNAAAVSFDPGMVSGLGSGLNAPLGAAADGSGNIYVADAGNNRVVKYSASGASTVIAGTGVSGYTGDGGLATAAKLASPSAVALTPGGLLYIADTGNNVIRVVNPVTGGISTIAGGASTVCVIARDAQGDGCIGSATTFSKPAGLVSDLYGNIYVSDTGNNLIREINPQGYVSLVGGGAKTVCSSTTLTVDSYGDNCPPLQATFNAPTGLAIDSNQNIYIADTGNSAVREIVATINLVVDVAGTGVAGSGSSNGLASSAQVNVPTGVAVDAAGNLYIADTGNHAVRMVPGNANIDTIIGTLGSSSALPLASLPYSAASILLNQPSAVLVLNSGNLVVVDAGNNRVISDDRSGVTYNFGRTNIGYTSPTLQILETETGSTAATLGNPLLSLSGSASFFSLQGTGSNGCASGTTLAPGQSCSLAASFSPVTAILNQTVSAAYVETNTNTVNAQQPYINLSGFAAILTPATSTVTLTNAASAPQYGIPFNVTGTVTAASCNTAAPNCYPIGNVQVYVDGALNGVQALTPGTGTTATLTIKISSPLSVGSHTIYLVYQTDGFYAGNTSPTLNFNVTPETTTSAVVASANPVLQFNAITLSATISATAGKPTGQFSFYAGKTLLGSAGINAATGLATLNDVQVTATQYVPAYYYNWGLAAGTYQITVVYSGDANYSASTSAAYSLQISAVPQSFAAQLINPAEPTIVALSNIAATYPGASTALDVAITPSNTLNGNVTFTCTGMPANSTCGFSPTALPFVPQALMPVQQFAQITFWTNVNPAVIPSASSFGSGWLMIGSTIVLLFGIRRKSRMLRRMVMIPAIAVLFVGTAMMSGCSADGRTTQYPTPLGSYNVTVTATGPNGQSISLPVTFTVSAPQ